MNNNNNNNNSHYFGAMNSNNNSNALGDENDYVKQVESLETAKQELLFQLESFERNLQLNSNSNNNNSSNNNNDITEFSIANTNNVNNSDNLNAMASAGVDVDIASTISAEKGSRQFTITCINTSNSGEEDGKFNDQAVNPNMIIRGVIVHAEKLLEGGSSFYYPNNNDNNSNKRNAAHSITIDIYPKNDIDVDIDMFVMLSPRNDVNSINHGSSIIQKNSNNGITNSNYNKNSNFFIVRRKVRHSKFSMFRQLPSNDSKRNDNYSKPESFVSFKLFDRVTRVPLWVNKTFGEAMEKQLLSAVQFEVAFEHVGKFKRLQNNTNKDDYDTNETDDRGAMFVLEVLDDCIVKIYSSSMLIISDVIRSLCTFLDVHDLDILSAEFPQELEQLSKLLDDVREFGASGSRLGAGVAESSAIVKQLVIKAEDAR